MDNHTSNSLPEHEGPERNELASQPAKGHGAGGNGAPLPEVVPLQSQETGPILPAASHNGSLTRSLIPQRSVPVAAPPAYNDQGKGTPRLLVISALVLTILLSAVMSLSIVPGQVEIRPGMPATQDILSPAYLNFQSKVLTEKARNTAMNDQANEVWAQDTATVLGQRLRLVNALSVVLSIRESDTFDTNGVKSQRLANIPGIKLTSQQIDLLLGLSDDEYKHWQDNGVVRGFDAAMKDRRLASPSDVAVTRQELPSLLVPSLSSDQKAAATAFISPMLAVNMHLDEEQTKQRQQDAATTVKPVIQSVQKGEAILRQGELATPEAIEKMEEAGLLSRVPTPQTAVGTTGIVALLMILLHLYIYRYAPRSGGARSSSCSCGMLLVSTVVTARLFLPGHPCCPTCCRGRRVHAGRGAPQRQPGGARNLCDVHSAGHDAQHLIALDMVLYYFVGGLPASHAHEGGEGQHVRPHRLLHNCGIFPDGVHAARTGGRCSGRNGNMDALARGDRQWVHIGFDYLRRLLAARQPLRHHHPAPSDGAGPPRPAPAPAADARGPRHLPPLAGCEQPGRARRRDDRRRLAAARVSAYYHDIGKVEHPYYFIDNQAGRGEHHDNLSPWESARHHRPARPGRREPGREAQPPRRVLDAIPQHHGTMLIKFFYYKALQLDPSADPADFRYPGPKPQTKETAILMLADGVEATVRSMAQSGALDKMAAANSDASESPALYTDASSLSDDAISDRRAQTINERIEDGQLDECDLTVRDIAPHPGSLRQHAQGHLPPTRGLPRKAQRDRR